ncbi:MAG TPA: substrate-binding domain-containing protein [Vicinamibacteria bacterium]|nr:substrate-binding domain-containing protein [Vicinamibacteria bacterium]
MTKRVALLLDDPDNRYQQLLVREARASAQRCRVELAEPEFAGGSSWTQVESVNRHLRETRPDGVLVMLAGGQWTRSPFERLPRAGVAVVLLNRIPDWVEELRREHPKALIAGVTPRQEGVGEIQAGQALRLARPGSLVVLVTGEASSAAAVGRTRGFREKVAGRLAVHEIDGRWSAKGAEKALGEWFRVGAERDRPIGLVVCQNDAMAGGARAALAKQAADSGRGELGRTLLIGCDGMEQEGKAMVARGELAATVVMPPTTPPALEILKRHWDAGTRSGTVLLDASSHPALDALGSP